jgi:ankyrin repeat protein
MSYRNILYNNCHRRTPLHYACEKGNTDTVSLLLNHGAEINIGDKEG